MEEKIKNAYNNYMSYNLADFKNVNQNILYANNWYILTGRSITAPHPHRHYTLLEFAYYCGKDNILLETFTK